MLPEKGQAAALDTLLNEVHSACYVFDPAPTLAWEIDEEQLHRDVQGAWNEYFDAGGAAVPAPKPRVTERL